MTHPFKKTKIVATIGPASESEEMLIKLINAGVNVIRLNFSHGTHEEHGKRIQLVRKLSKQQDKPIGIIQDLQGPKIRLGTLREERQTLKKGDVVTLFYGDQQVDEKLPVQIDIFPYLKKSHAILINDGLVRLRVDSVGKQQAQTTVINEGEIGSHKGVNLPDTILPSMALTQKDREDLAFGLSQGVDYIAISFVQTEEDIIHIKKLVAEKNKQVKIIAKIECAPAMKHLEKIIQEADVVMVARGDLAVEVGQEEVPLMQRRIIDLCRLHGKPVIVATQMLESMTTHAEPTRAEVNDVATAVLDQVDAVMLSAESASGKYPVETVTIMDKIIRRIENHEAHIYQRVSQMQPNGQQLHSIALSSAMLANTLSVRIIFTLTESGNTAIQLSQFRPKMPIIALSDNQSTCNQLSLVWGVKCLQVPKITDNITTFTKGVESAKEKGILTKGDKIVLVGGTDPGISGHINTIQVETIV